MEGSKPTDPSPSKRLGREHFSSTPPSLAAHDVFEDEGDAFEARSRSDSRSSNDLMPAFGGPDAVGMMAPALVVADQKGNIKSFNSDLEMMFGYGPGEVQAFHLSQLFPNPYRDRIGAFLDRQLSEASTMQGVTRTVEGIRKDGTVFPMVLSVSRLNVEDQVYFTALMEKLDEKVGSFTFNTSGKISMANQMAAEILGYTDAGELVGRKVYMLMLPPYSGRFDSFLKSSDTSHWNVQFRHKEGYPIWLDFHIAKSESADFFSSTIEEVSDIEGVFAFDKDGVIRACNHRFLTLFGLAEQSEVIDSNIQRFDIPRPDFMDTIHYRPEYATSQSPTENRVLMVKHSDTSLFLVNIDFAQYLASDGSVMVSANITRVADDLDDGPHAPVLRPLYNWKGEQYVNAYLVGKTLGEGTFGEVKLGTHRITNAEVAIKIFDNAMISRMNAQSAIDMEIEVLKSCNHPNIIQLVEIIRTPDYTYLVMELAAGGDLTSHVARRGVPEDEARKLFRQIVSAMEHVYHQGFAHRDLKLENIVLGEDKTTVKLIDFGECIRYDYSGPKHQKICGNPVYAAPEMLRGEGYYGPEVDIWSLGVILFTLVVGYVPFHCVQDVLEGNLRLEDNVSSDLNRLVSKLFQTEPSERPKITDLLTDEWVNKGFEQQPVLVSPTKEKVHLDQKVIEEMGQFGLDSEFAQWCVANDHYNSVSATYYLLQMKRKSQAGPSTPSGRGKLGNDSEDRLKRVTTAPGRLDELMHEDDVWNN